MKIIKIIGGLGNQMFQYALYESFLIKNENEEIKIDISAFEQYKVHNGFELKKIFDIDPKIASKDEVRKLANISRFDNVQKIKRKLGIKKSSHIIQKSFDYNNEIISIKGDKYLEGYWQSYKYFEENKDIIRTKFKFKNKLDKNNKQILNMIESTESVSIHIRRGDYISNSRANKLHGDICNKEYYQQALDMIFRKVENPSFYVFSDDINWAKNNLPLKYTYVFIDYNEGNDSYKDMQLMSECKHNIIANSTFSWWGAWLNKNNSKIVICPKIWFNNKKINTSDLKPKEWIEI